MVSKDFRAYERALSMLDDESWSILKNKALQHYYNHRQGQKKQGFFHQLNESFAYSHLVKQGFRHVRFLEEGKKRTPDIVYTDRGVRTYCEVKSLSISDEEIERRNAIACYDSSVYFCLSD
jgi:predicted AAA+ superfamily ATPase